MRSILFSVIFFLSFSIHAAQDCIPTKPSPARFVNDFAGIFSRGEIQALEQKIKSFEDSTSNQIVVAIVTDLCDFDKAEFAVELGEQWGVGQEDKDNGIIILLKPKEIDGKGEAFIATGYGLEGAVPDATAKLIIENEMIPNFKNKDYYGGVANAVQTIMSLTSGEYTAEDYQANHSTTPKMPPILIFLLFGFIFFIFFMRTRFGGRGGGMTMMGTGSSWSSGRGWGSGGSFGGSSFGGGSFGGGGSGGSW